MDPRTWALVRLMLNENKYSRKVIAKTCSVSVGSVVNISRQPVRRSKAEMLTRPRGGRPRALSERSRRLLLRQLRVVRQKKCRFSIRQVRLAAGLTKACSLATCYREVSREGYSWENCRRKGVLTKEDRKIRLKWCREHLDTPATHWTDGIAFYFDGVGFQHKLHPFAAHCTPPSRTWMKKDEKLLITRKASHEGSKGRSLHFFVGVSHKAGVVICKKYEKMSAKLFAKFVRENFPQAFLLSRKTHVFLQDNDPCQTSRAGKRAIKAINAEQFFIPARSPDINPIENLFHLVKQKLAEDALENEIFYESVEEFEKRVISAIHELAALHMDRTIESMTKRILEIFKNGGARCSY